MISRKRAGRKRQLPAGSNRNRPLRKTIKANDNLQPGRALDNDLSRQPDETSQQHADRLLDAKRCGVSMDPTPVHPQVINRPAFDKLDEASATAEYTFALCYSILDKIESLNGLYGPKGIAPNESTEHFVQLASTLCSLQLDQILKLRKEITEAIHGWPMTTGYAL